LKYNISYRACVERIKAILKATETNRLRVVVDDDLI
jgi:hypothetical protein